MNGGGNSNDAWNTVAKFIAECIRTATGNERRRKTNTQVPHSLRIYRYERDPCSARAEFHLPQRETLLSRPESAKQMERRNLQFVTISTQSADR
jgi:hypothetical protein